MLAYEPMRKFMNYFKSESRKLIKRRVSEWLLFNANSAILQLYHGYNKLIFNEMMMRICIVLANWNNSPRALGHIILIPNQPVFVLSPYAACLAEKQQITIL